MSSDQDKHPLSDLIWSVPPHMKDMVDYCLWRTNWEGITETASSARQGQPCKLLPYYRYLSNYRMERVVEFEDGTHWSAWVQLMEAFPNTIRSFEEEVDTIALVRSRSKAPVARVFAYHRNDQNRAGAAFMLTEFLPGNTAYEDAKRWRSVPDETSYGTEAVPLQFRQKFLRDVAAAHVQIASVRLPQIGRITRDAQGNLAAGPIPGVGGPFDTADAYFEALAAVISFGGTEDHTRSKMTLAGLEQHVDKMLKDQREFPGRLAKLAASGKLPTSKGPFPIYHPHFDLASITVDKEFNVLGVSDWKHVETMPWEMLDAPLNRNTRPRLFCPPNEYDENGQPVKPEAIRELAEEHEYTAMVREAEQIVHADHKLSDALADRDMRDLSQLINLFVGSSGNIAPYHIFMDYLEKKYLGT